MRKDCEESLNEQDWDQDWDDLKPTNPPARPLNAVEVAEGWNRLAYSDAVQIRNDILLRAHEAKMGKNDVTALTRAALAAGYSWEIEKIGEFWPARYDDLPLSEWPKSLLIGTERVDALGLENLPKKDAVFVLLEAAHMEKFGRQLVEFGFKRIYGKDLAPGAWVVVDTWPEVYGKD